MSMKLVKPPEKKTVLQTKIEAKKPVNPPTITPNTQQSTKVNNGFDIMDLDLGAMATSSPLTTNKTEIFDFLGSPQPEKA